MPSYRDLKASVGLSSGQPGRKSYSDLKAAMGLSGMPNSDTGISLKWESHPQPVANAPAASSAVAIAPVDTITATNERPSLFGQPGPETPGISAQPRGQKLTVPPVPLLGRIGETGMALTSGALKGATAGFSQDFLKGEVPDLEDIQKRHPVATGIGTFGGAILPIGGWSGVAEKLGAEGVSRLAIGMGVDKAIRDRDPKSFFTGFAEGLALETGLHGVGKVYKAARDARAMGLAQDAVKGMLKSMGVAEETAFPEQFIAPASSELKVPAVRRGAEPPYIPEGVAPPSLYKEPQGPTTEAPAKTPQVASLPRVARGDEAKTILDAPRTPDEIARQKAGAAATTKFEESLNVPGPEPVQKPPTNPQVEAQIDEAIKAAKVPEAADPKAVIAVKQETLKADREHFQNDGLDRAEANKAAETLAQGDFVGLSKDEGAKIRRQFSMDALSPAEREARLRVVSEVKAAGTDAKALDIADDVLANERAITRHEHAAMELKAADLVDEYDRVIAEGAKLVDAGDNAGAALARGRSEVILDQVDRLTRAADTGGRELARDFGFRRTMIDKNTMDLARVMQRAKVAKGSKLTTTETARIEEVISELKRVEAENVRLTAAHSEAQAALEKARAEGIVTRIAKRKSIVAKAESSREGLRAQREDIKKQIAALGFRLNDVTGVSAEASYLIGKLAVNYVREGATNLDEVVRLVLHDIPGLTERDVHESLNAKNPKMQKRAQADVEKRIGQLKTQARLLTEIEDAQKGIFAEKGPHWTTTAPEDIQTLRKVLTKLRAQAYRSGMAPSRIEKALKQINELQDQLANQYRAVKKQTRPLEADELRAAKDKIKQLRRTMKVEDDLSDLQEQLRTGDFKIPEPRVATKLPPELERNQVELNAMRKKVRAEIENLKPRTPGQKYGELVNTMRTMVASGDMSAAFRQGFVPTARMLFTDPASLGKIEATAFKSFFDSYTADAADAAMRAAPQHYVRVKAGLFLPELGTPPIKGEETYLSDLAHKVPVMRDVVKASERHMITLLNLLRAHRFDSFLENNPNATSEELKAMANWINVSSGRGDLGKYSGALNGLSTFIFAPRFAWSRIQTPYQLARYWKMPRVRNEIAKDLAATVGLGVSVLTAAKLSGLEVGDPLDPNNPDWGKIKVGNTRFDIFAGFQQPARIVARVMNLARLRAKNIGSRGIGLAQGEGSLDDLLKQEKEEAATNPLELLGRFTAYKAAPVVSLASEALTGKDLVGNKVTPLGILGSHLIPLMLQDVWDAYKDSGISGRTAAVGAATFSGIGASTYANKKSSGPTHIPQLHKPLSLPRVGAGR